MKMNKNVRLVKGGHGRTEVKVEERSVDREVKAFFQGDLGWQQLSGLARHVILSRATLTVTKPAPKPPTIAELFRVFKEDE
jgi:hypothetical protein